MGEEARHGRSWPGAPHILAATLTFRRELEECSTFDLIELNGDDPRREPLVVRRATLASVLARTRGGIRFNEHVAGDAARMRTHRSEPERA